VRYSATVVAPMQLRFPRASAGFMILAASMLPSALPRGARQESLIVPGITCWYQHSPRQAVPQDKPHTF
jgi:hypothetical protein